MDWFLTFISFAAIATLMGSLWSDSIGVFDSYDSDFWKFFKCVGFGISVGAVAFLIITGIVNISADVEYKAGETKPVNKISVYDGSNNDVFYVWREDTNNGGYYVSIRNGNISEKMNVSIEKIKVVPSYEPAQYVKYEPVFKDTITKKSFPMWKSSFGEVQVPDKYVKIKPGF